jgi:acetylornithine/succinyldiaminopimelate/putrescine aminotransferase
MPGFKFVDYNNLDAIKNAINENTAAVLLEPIQGEGGVLPADKEYLKAVRELCNEKGILLLFDEVQCGIGRTGTFYAFQNYGVEPDAISLAKAIANGYPMGAFIVKREYANTLTVGMHASTFGGTPLASAAALAVVKAFDEENILENCQKQSEYFFKKLNELKIKFSEIKEVRGKGLMIGIVLDQPAGAVVNELRKLGMLALTAGEVVLRLLPPLNITKEEVDTALQLIDKAMSKLFQG